MTQDVAVVVGATGAIGSAVVDRLVAKGLEVVAVARHEAALAQLARERVHPCVADLASDDAVAAVGAGLAELMNGGAEGAQTGRRLRLAVFAAGLPVRGSVETIEPVAPTTTARPWAVASAVGPAVAPDRGSAVTAARPRPGPRRRPGGPRPRRRGRRRRAPRRSPRRAAGTA